MLLFCVLLLGLEQIPCSLALDHATLCAACRSKMASRLEDVEADLRDVEEELQATENPEEKRKLMSERRKLRAELRGLQRPVGVTESFFVANLPTAVVSAEVYLNLARHHWTVDLQLVLVGTQFIVACSLEVCMQALTAT